MVRAALVGTYAAGARLITHTHNGRTSSARAEAYRSYYLLAEAGHVAAGSDGIVVAPRYAAVSLRASGREASGMSVASGAHDGNSVRYGRSRAATTDKSLASV